MLSSCPSEVDMEIDKRYIEVRASICPFGVKAFGGATCNLGFELSRDLYSAQLL